MNEVMALAAEQTANPAEEVKDGEINPEVEKRLAEQLRQMIKDGMTDDCAICLSDFDHPVSLKRVPRFHRDRSQGKRSLL